MNPNLTKSCSNCGEVLELEEFPRDASKGDDRKAICKACDAARAKAYYQANRERVLARVSARYEELNKDVPEYRCAECVPPGSGGTPRFAG